MTWSFFVSLPLVLLLLLLLIGAWLLLRAIGNNNADDAESLILLESVWRKLERMDARLTFLEERLMDQALPERDEP